MLHTLVQVMVPHTMPHSIPMRICIPAPIRVQLVYLRHPISIRTTHHRRLIRLNLRHPISIRTTHHRRLIRWSFLATKTLTRAQSCDNGLTRSGN
jgi:hypothetical protein